MTQEELHYKFKDDLERKFWWTESIARRDSSHPSWKIRRPSSGSKPIKRAPKPLIFSISKPKKQQ